MALPPRHPLTRGTGNTSQPPDTLRKTIRRKAIIIHKAIKEWGKYDNNSGTNKSVDPLKIPHSKQIKVATFNIRGINEITKRQQLDEWMDSGKIDIALLQETKINTNSIERGLHTFTYFNTEVDPAARDRIEQKRQSGHRITKREAEDIMEKRGTAIMVHQRLAPYIKQVTTHGGRTMALHLHGAPGYTIINTYCPHADFTREEKEKHYESLTDILTEAQHNSIPIIGGDFNARLYSQQGLAREVFGKWILPHPTESSPVNLSTIESRDIFTTFCTMKDLWAANTHFEKPPWKLVTAKITGTNRLEPPFNATCYGQIDYILTTNRWKNVIHDVEIDTKPSVVSDHFPLVAKIRCRLTRHLKKPRPSTSFVSNPTADIKKALNVEVWETYMNKTDGQRMTIYEEWHPILLKAQATHLETERSQRPKKDYISDRTWGIIQTRDSHRHEWNAEQLKASTRLIRNAARKDRKNWIISTMAAELDQRDQWLGIKRLRQGYRPRGYEKISKEGHPIPTCQQAEAMASHLEQTQWGPDAVDQSPASFLKNPDDPHYYITQAEARYAGAPKYNIDPFTPEEVDAAIKQLKKGKAPGPDGLKSETLKCLSDVNRPLVVSLMNVWWYTKRLPDDELEAAVIPIFKKGDPRVLDNYRPISLLTTLNKLYAILIRGRLQDTADENLPATFFGFRKGKSTADAIHIIRRIQEKAEIGHTPCHIILLDWSKAFDRIRIPKLLEALRRHGIHEELIEAVASLYRSPSFTVTEHGCTSAKHRQHRGIRQGCPLSPFLFVILMSALMWDAEHDPERTTHRDKLKRQLGFADLCYADDTALFGFSYKEVEQSLQAIERQAGSYGMSLNKSKCIHISMYSRARVKFSDGSPVPTADEATYLGAHINNAMDPRQEIIQRLKKCSVIWRKLGLFWKQVPVSNKFKLLVHNAIIRSTLMYGLEAMQIPEDLLKRMDAFQLKGIRQILKITTTFVDRSHTNKFVIQQANKALRYTSPTLMDRKLRKKKALKKFRQVTLFSKFVKVRSQKFMAHVIRADPDDPIRISTLQRSKIKPRLPRKRRVGRPRLNWSNITLAEMWLKARPTTIQADFDPNSRRHNLYLLAAARNRIF